MTSIVPAPRVVAKGASGGTDGDLEIDRKSGLKMTGESHLDHASITLPTPAAAASAADPEEPKNHPAFRTS